MLDLPLLYRNFVSAVSFEAGYETARGVETLLLEARNYMNRLNEPSVQSLFTRIGDREVRVRSLQDLILQEEECLSLSVPHLVTVLRHRVSQQATLTEVYLPWRAEANPPQRGPVHGWSVRLLLHVGADTYGTDPNDCLQEAFSDLYELTGADLRFRICYSCDYSFPALPGPHDEREELRRFRDVPEAYQEIKARSKFASREVLSAGDFFVSGFHACAAWKPWLPAWSDSQGPQRDEAEAES